MSLLLVHKMDTVFRDGLGGVYVCLKGRVEVQACSYFLVLCILPSFV